MYGQNTLGRNILKNPGPTGKFYVMNSGKKVYKFSKNFVHTNNPGLYTVDQLQAIAKSRGLTGYSKLKKEQLFLMLAPETGRNMLKNLRNILKNENYATSTMRQVKIKLRAKGHNTSSLTKNVIQTMLQKVYNKKVAKKGPKKGPKKYVYNPNKNRFRTINDIIHNQ